MIKICLAWFVAILISSPQLFLYKIIQVPFNATTNVSTCYADWNSFSLSINWELIYIMYHLILQYFLPIILLIYYFTRIFLNVSPNRRNKTKETIDLIRSITILTLIKKIGKGGMPERDKIINLI